MVTVPHGVVRRAAKVDRSNIMVLWWLTVR